MMVVVFLVAYVASVLTVLAALFRGGRRLRLAAVLAGTVAIWLPFLILRSSLGLPSPFTRPGDYQILGSSLDVPAKRMYVMLDVFEGFTAPRLYSLPYKRDSDPLEQDFDMDRNPYAYIGMGIHMGPGGQLNLLKEPGELPDWDKDKYYENPAAFLVRPRHRQ